MKKLAMVALVALLLSLVGASVYALDWPWSKAKEVRPAIPGAQTIINRQREELRRLLIDAHARNIALKNALADSNWQNFPLRDYSDPTSPTYILRTRIERNLDGLFTTYKALLRNYASEIDRVATKRDGTPYAAGDFMRNFWTGTREPPCNSDLNMTREEIVDELQAGRCGAPQAKWIVYFRDALLPDVERVTSAARYENMNDVPLEGIGEGFGGTENWTSLMQRWSEYFDGYAAIFKRVYEAPGMFGAPIPPKIEIVPPVLEPMRPE